MPETNNTIDLVLLKDIKCKSCGGEIWTPPKQNGEARKKDYCSLKCCQGHHDKIRKAKIESGEIEPQKHKYRYRSPAQKSQSMTKETMDKWTFTCECCNKEFIPASRSTSNSNKFCSRTCMFESIRQRTVIVAEFSKVYFRQCNECGKQLDTRDRTGRSCSDTCRDIRSDRLQKKHNDLYKGSDAEILYLHKKRVAHRCKQKPTNCTVCGIFFTPFNSRSHTCSHKHQKKYEKRTHKTHERRAKYHGVKYEPVNRLDVFNRDNWTCQACGCDTPLSLMGKQDDNAPQLDHIIPVSKGGDHVISNLQCFCLVCNALKSDADNDMFLYNINK